MEETITRLASTQTRGKINRKSQVEVKSHLQTTASKYLRHIGDVVKVQCLHTNRRGSAHRTET